MLFIKELYTENFKNLKSAKIKFDSKYVCFAGNNGAGKTNLLDAIHYLAMGKSYFNSIDLQNINYHKDYFNIKCRIEKQGEDFDLFCAYVKGLKKKIKKNEVEYERLSEHVGQFPVVIVTPYDNSLITGGSEERRRFLDMIISQYDSEYLESLFTYNRILQQRNAQLKTMFETGQQNASLLGIYNIQLCEPGEQIYRKRKEFVKVFCDLTLKYYGQISNQKEEISLNYKSQLDDNSLEKQLCESFQKDFYTQRTNVGVHKDDLPLFIHHVPAKRFASQGQQKSYLLSMKIAQFNILKESTQIEPLFLLDDIFDRLDQERTTRLLDIITANGFGQIFLTDTNADRVKKVFGKLGKEIQVLNISDGEINS